MRQIRSGCFEKMIWTWWKEVGSKMKSERTEKKIAIGIPSGDCESFCFDVTRDCFVELEEREPDVYDGIELDASMFYVDLYRVYHVPRVGLWSKQYKTCKTLLKVEYDDWGVITIEGTSIPVINKV